MKSASCWTYYTINLDTRSVHYQIASFGYIFLFKIMGLNIEFSESVFDLWNVCYHSFQNRWCTKIILKNVKIKYTEQ